MFMRFATLATVATLAMPVMAQESEAEVLFDLLMLPDIVEIMREEGVSYGGTVGQDLFAGPASAEWAATVERIYDYEMMQRIVRVDFMASLVGADLEPITDFFSSQQGQIIVGLEVNARRALLDDAVKGASKEAAAIAIANDNPRIALISEFVDINNLIENNVEGALNSNLAFYKSIFDGNAFDDALSEKQILLDVWSQEATIRESTTEWIYSFLFMAFQPLNDVDLQAYIAFSETASGAVINRAIFESFDRLFMGISRSLGSAAANEMMSKEL